MSLRQFIEFTVVLFTISYSHLALASDDTAYAFPVEDILIDGDLSDWPDHLPVIEIKKNYFGKDMPKADQFSARFRTAYSVSKKAIYVAMEINDDVHIVEDRDDATWNLYDGCILYFDPIHSIHGSGYWVFHMRGDERDVIGAEYSWDPATRTNSWDRADAKVVRSDKKTIYEIQVDLSEHFKIGMTYGLDFLIADQDSIKEGEEGQLYVWGPSGGKSRGASKLRELLLVDPESPLVTLKGTVEWAKGENLDESEPWNDSRVRVVSTEKKNVWFTPRPKDGGVFELKLPPGNYKVGPHYHRLGEAFINLKMMDHRSTMNVSVSAESVDKEIKLVVNSRPEPTIIPDKAILFDYDESKKSIVDNFVDTYMEYLKLPGVSIALIHDGKVVYHRVAGVRNGYTGEPVTKSTLFEAASITKIVFAFAVNRLAERGVIDLDRPLHEYLPFKEIEHDKRYLKITARHCLSHQTGFPNWAYNNDDGKIDIKFYPGIKHGYSGEGFEYLGRVVAHITGKSLEEVIKEETQEPMNCVENMYFADCPELRAVASCGHYNMQPNAVLPPDEIGTAHSMHTEALSFSNFLIGLLQKKGLSAESYEKMFEPQVEVPFSEEYHKVTWPRRYGLGFDLHMTPHGKSIGHGGHNGDFMCLCEIFPDKNVGYAVFTNSYTGAEFHRRLRELLVVDIEDRLPKMEMPVVNKE